MFFLKQAVAKVNKGMKTEEEAVPTWFKSYMDRVLYSKNIILLWIFAYNSEIALEKLVSHNKQITSCWIWSKLLQNCSQSSLQFKDQVVREVVDRMCSEFSGQCCTHRDSDPPAEEPSTSGTQKATSSTTLRVSSSTPNCSSCKGPATGGGYQCRWECPKTCLTHDTL